MGRRSSTWRPSGYVLFSALVHLASAAFLASRPESWAWALGALGLDHAGLALGGLLPRSRLLGPNVTSFKAEGRCHDGIVLTFDDGPDPATTPRVLDVLERAGCSASFFCIGHRAADHGQIVEEIARRGHGVENHSFSHSKAFAFYGPRTLGRELDRTQELLGSLTGKTPRYFRAPAGIRSVFLDPALQRRGLSLVSWTRRGFDTVDRNPARVARRLLHRIAPGDVLVLHDGFSHPDRGGQPVVLETLKRVVEALDRRGLRARSLPSGP